MLAKYIVRFLEIKNEANSASVQQIFLFILAKRHGSPNKQTQRSDTNCSFGRKIIRKSYNQTPGKTIPKIIACVCFICFRLKNKLFGKSFVYGYWLAIICFELLNYMKSFYSINSAYYFRDFNRNAFSYIYLFSTRNI